MVKAIAGVIAAAVVAVQPLTTLAAWLGLFALTVALAALVVALTALRRLDDYVLKPREQRVNELKEGVEEILGPDSAPTDG